MMDHKPRVQCHLYGRADALFSIEAHPLVQSGNEHDMEGVQNLAICLVRSLSPDQVLQLLYQLQCWQRLVLVQHLSEDALRQDRWLQVLLPSDPIGFEYRMVPEGSSLGKGDEVNYMSIAQDEEDGFTIGEGETDGMDGENEEDEV